MKNSQIERWALNVIERVEARQPIEDSRVELKAKWPDDFAKAARRIAGHANAARGEHILWLIGVDEDTGVIGAEYADMADWSAGIASQFDSLVPRCYDLNVPTINGKTIVTLAFETDRAPYVIKNPHYGKRKDDPISLEVPWRIGTQIRTATRANLLQLFTDVNLLQALLQELEFNLAAANRFSLFRREEFNAVMKTRSLSVFADKLKQEIYDAYIEMNSAERVLLRNDKDVNPKFGRIAFTVSLDVGAHMKEASSKIEKALVSLRQSLDISQSE